MTKVVDPNRSRSLDRRSFVSAVTLGAASSVVAGETARAAEDHVVAPAAPPAASTPVAPSASVPSTAAAAAETSPPPHDMHIVGRSGSDHMVDVLHGLPLDYVTTMPGSTFRGLQESIINYGNNQKPELLTCLHEEITVGMGHGYAKVAGKPLAALVHGVVGLQHASMAIYNAWADRVPVIVIVGNTLAIEERRPGVEWTHSAQDNAAIVRDFTKWDDMPASLEHFSESMVRAYGIATAVPRAPTVIIADGELQEREIAPKPLKIPNLSKTSTPVGDSAALAEAAKMLVAATAPVIIVDRLVSSAEGMKALIEFAELLQAPVVDKNGRMNMPSRHYLNHSYGARTLMHEADVIIGIEVRDLFGVVNSYRDRIERDSRPILKPGSKLISLTAEDLLTRSNFQDFQRYQPVDLAIVGDGEATLPALIEAVKRVKPASTAYDDRGKKLRDAQAAIDLRLRQAATYGWDATPISVARLVATIGNLLQAEDWALTSTQQFQSDWPKKLWNFDKHYQHIGGAGGYGVGYTGPSSIGAALAHRDIGGRIPVAIMGDGELMCCPGIFWTAAHHKIPLLMVMHNNRAYHQEAMHIQRMADRHARGIDRAHIGTSIDNPNIDFAKLADSMGVWSKGPITDPADLAPALKQAIAMVKQGVPALVDVVCQGR